ncbi:hypothetical protein L218DRAFT_509373 [Marasmius fiardii PR-910]|nr:hypothetical protein L218DRAFT_509373 [Marasmius fiardii PR-910]
MTYIMESHPDCRYVLSQYIAFQHVTILGECVPPFLRHLSQMWVRPQDGTIVCGPKGPGINARIPFVAPDIARTLQSRDLAPPMPLNLYHSRDLLNYLASWLSGGFIPPRPCYKGVRDPVSPFDLHLAVLSTSSASPNIIAKFLQSGGDVPWKYIGDHPLQVLMDDGRIRFQHNCPPRDLHSHGSFDVGHSDEEKLAFIWLAQASHVFERLNIPRNDWVDYGFIHRVSLNLVPRYTDGTSVSPFNNEAADEFEFPFYLLARPYPRFSDGFLDIMSWTSSTNLYYWSSDPDGHSEMTEEEHVVLGLPCYIPKVEVHMQTWELEDYDFMRELQEAKGFDSSTTNFARSIGVPILEIVYAENDRFEVFSNEEYSDENGSSVLTTISPARGNAMEVDFESHRDGTVASWPPEGVEDMDVDIEDCCSRMESLAVEVGMEVDN